MNWKYKLITYLLFCPIAIVLNIILNINDKLIKWKRKIKP